MLALALSCEAQTNITLTLTITNSVTNGYSIQINSGPARVFTNYVSNPANQIQQTNSELQTATNLWLAFSGYPNISPYVTVSMTGSNVIQFSSFGALTITTNSSANPGLPSTYNWCSFTLVTNTFTSETALRYPTNGLGIIEQSNAAYGIFGFLNSPYMTNAAIATAAVNAALPQWSNFINAASLAALSNAMLTAGTNTTNFIRIVGTNTTNYANTLFTNAEIFAASLSTNATNYAFGLGTLWSNSFASISSIAPWQDAAHDVYLTNAGSGTNSLRFYAAINGSTTMYDAAGSQFFENASGQLTAIQDSGSINRLEVDAPASSGGTTIGGTMLRSKTGNIGLQISGYNDGIQTWSPISFSIGTIPTTVGGVLTNFWVLARNTGNGASTTNVFTIPANALTNNGDMIVRDLFIGEPNSKNSQRIQITFADQGALTDTTTGYTTSGAYFSEIELIITRTGANAYQWTSSLKSSGNNVFTNQYAANLSSSFNSGSGWSATSAISLVFTTQSSGGSTGDFNVWRDTIYYYPSANWQTLLP